MNNTITVATFLSTLKAEVRATQEARQTITSDAVQSEQQYHDAVQTAHYVVGSRVPSRTSTISQSSTLRSKTVGATRTFGTAISDITQRDTSNTAVPVTKKEEFHVYFDPEQDLDALMEYKPKRSP